MEINKTGTVIIGAGLTGLTLAFYLKQAGKSFVILERTNRTGGDIRTIKIDDFIFETGPNSGSMSTVELAELFEDLKNDCQLEVVNKNGNNRWILKNSQWHNLPSGIISGIRTPLFSFKDKLRLLGEPFRPKGTNPNESVAELVIRRMGQSFLDYAVDPFIGGIYSGNPNMLVTRFALPKLYNLEQNYGSFIGGAIKKPKKQGRELKASGKVFATKGGLQNLTDALTNKIGIENINLEVNNTVINPDLYGFKINYLKNDKSQTLSAKNVVTTSGGFELPKLLPFVSNDKMLDINNAKYAKLSQIVLMYKKWEGIKLNAFGGLIPSKENKQILGILFPSSLFSGRVKNEGAILSIFAGGINHPDFIKKTDSEIEKIVLTEVKSLFKTNNAPDIIKIYRYNHAIPQYEGNSEKRFNAIESTGKKYDGLFIAGSIKDGIGIPNRVKQAKEIADKIISNK